MTYSTRTLKLMLTVVLVLMVSVSLLPLGGAVMGADGPKPAQAFGNISGKVLVEGTNAVAPGGKVWVEDYTTGEAVAGFFPVSASSGTGSYMVFEIPVGSYRLRATATGYAGEWWNNVYKKADATAVAVVADQTTSNIIFYLAPGGSVGGSVANNAFPNPALLSGATVTAQLPSLSIQYTTTSGANGLYSIGGIPYGDYKVSAVGGKSWEGDTTRWASQFYNLKDSFDTADPVTVSSTNANRTNINFNLVQGAAIEGNIRNETGGYVSGATISAEGFTSRQLATQATTDTSGRYRLEGLVAGDYRIYATAPNRVLKYYNETYEGTFEWWSATPVHVNAGEGKWIGDMKLEAGGPITGTVTAEGTVNPIANANVTANDFGTGKFVASVLTGTNGTYSLIAPEGDYRVSARATGYAREYYNNVVDPASAQFVHAKSGFTASGINFTLSPGGTIAGKVSNQATPPAAIFNALVTAKPSTATYTFSARTDGQGNYTMVGLPFGSYTVWASIDKYLTQWYNLKADAASADPLPISSTAPDATGINFSLMLGGSIQGSVKQQEPPQNPIGGATIQLLKPSTFELITEIQAQNDGSYKIYGLATGDYIVHASTDVYQWRVPEFYNNAFNRDQAASVHVTAPNDTKNINFLLEQGGRVRGTVRDAGTNTLLEGVRVNVKGTTTDSRNLEFDRYTGADGGYEVWLPFGDYKVMAEGAGVNVWYKPQWYSGKQTETEADVIQIHNSGDWWAEFHLNKSGVITGHVYDLTGDVTTPLAGATVIAWDYNNGDESQDWNKRGQATTRADGSYSLFTATGDVRVKASAPVHVMKYYSNTFDQQAAQKVTVAVGAEVSNVNFTLEGGGSISGTVKDGQTGALLANANVKAASLTKSYRFEARTDTNGHYMLGNVPYGSYKVMANGGDSWNGGNPRYAPEWWQEKTSSDNADVVTLNSTNINPDNINFTLEIGGSISGHVYNAQPSGSQGNPEYGVWVTVRNATSGKIAGTAMTQGDGSYKLDGLVTGDYQLTASRYGLNREFYDGKGGWETADSVHVTAPNDTGGKDFILDMASGRISGNVAYKGTAIPNPQMNQIRIKAVDLRVGGMVGWEQILDAQPNPQGYYEMQGVGAGPYLVFAYMDVTAPMGTPNSGDPYGFYGSPTIVTITKTGANWPWVTGVDIDIDDALKGLLSGQARLQLRNNHAGATVAVGGKTTTTDASGIFMMSAPPGTRDIAFSKTGYLPLTLKGVKINEFFSGEPSHIPEVVLLTGDLDSNQVINIADLTAVAAHFNSASTAGDVDGNGFVNIFDLAQVAANFGKTESIILGSW